MQEVNRKLGEKSKEKRVYGVQEQPFVKRMLGAIGGHRDRMNVNEINQFLRVVRMLDLRVDEADNHSVITIFQHKILPTLSRSQNLKLLLSHPTLSSSSTSGPTTIPPEYFSKKTC
jgi:hypothetical protein